MGFSSKSATGIAAAGAFTLVQPDHAHTNGNFTFMLENAAGNYNEIMRMQSDGTVGIGTTSPTKKLDVSGDINFTGALYANGNAGTSGQFLTSQGTSTPIWQTGSTALNSTAWLITGNSGTNPSINFIGTTDSIPLIFKTKNTERMRIDENGNVGIGTLTPTAKLYIKSDTIKTGLIVETSFDSTAHGYGIISNVGLTGDYTKAFSVKKDTTENFIVYGNGHVLARDVVVKLGYLGDFVFAHDYKLLTIYELENYIKQNHHLPKIPSAKEVKESGLDVGEFQNLLLQKTEEQALYIINMQKQIDELKEKISTLESKIKQ